MQNKAALLEKTTILADLIRLGMPAADATYGAALVSRVMQTIAVDQGAMKAAYVSEVSDRGGGSYDVTLGSVYGDVNLTALAQLVASENNRFGATCNLSSTASIRVTILSKQAVATRGGTLSAGRIAANRRGGGGGFSSSSSPHPAPSRRTRDPSPPFPGEEEEDSDYEPPARASRPGEGASIIDSVLHDLGGDYEEIVRREPAKRRK